MRGARINVMNRGDDTPLHLAASHGHRDIVQKVCNTSVTGTITYSFPSPASTPPSHLGLCFLPLLLSGPGNQLLQYKADINAVNEHGNVPLHYACFWGQDQVAEVSIKALNPGMGGKSEPQWEIWSPHPIL